ncbi:MAG: DUF1501 domain-containing protein [Planctomycetes bacterium]|nr:DUF1501 domain-containing protein [Planctomycetota bacterium]
MLLVPDRDDRALRSAVWSRRELLRRALQGAAAGAVAPAFAGLFARHALAAAAAGTAAVRGKQLLLVWLDGGPSHFETFDPKPGVATGGPFGAIDTGIGDWRFSELLPELAQRAPHLSIVRTVTSKESSHGRARDLMHFGYRPNPSVDYPTLGAIAALEIGDREGDLPPFVQIGGTPRTAGHLPADCAPFFIADGNEKVANLECPDCELQAATGGDGTADARPDRERLEALRAAIDGEFRERGHGRTVELFETRRRAATRLMRSPLKKAFDLGDENDATRRRYGGRGFGSSMLLARRLLEAGVGAVEVELPGFDTHADNFPRHQKLCAALDPALAALVDDLIARGLWERTLVVCMGEFGRTPSVNAGGGRDHWPNNFPVLLGGGGIRPATVVGRTDDRGETILERPVQVADLFATFAALLGIDGDREFNPTTRRPTKLIDPDGAVVKELLA